MTWFLSEHEVVTIAGETYVRPVIAGPAEAAGVAWCTTADAPGLRMALVRANHVPGFDTDPRIRPLRKQDLSGIVETQDLTDDCDAPDLAERVAQRFLMSQVLGPDDAALPLTTRLSEVAAGWLQRVAARLLPHGVDPAALKQSTLLGDLLAATLPCLTVRLFPRAMSRGGTFTDNFNGAGANTDLASWTPSGGGAWTRVDGSSNMAVVTTGNLLLCNTSDVNGALYRCTDQGSADQYVQYRAKTAHVGAFTCNRASDRANYIGVRSAGSPAKVQIYRRSGGTLTQLGSNGATTVAINDVIRLESSGNAHEAFLNGVSQVGPANDATHNTVTRQGVNARWASVQWMDDFEAGVLGGGGDPLLAMIQAAAEDSWTQYITIPATNNGTGIWGQFQTANLANFDAFTVHGAVDGITSAAFANDGAVASRVVGVGTMSPASIWAFSNPLIDRATGDLWRSPSGGHNKTEHGEIIQIRASDGVAVLRHKSATLSAWNQKPTGSLETGPGTDPAEYWGYKNADGKDAARASEQYGFAKFEQGRLFCGGIQTNTAFGNHGPGRIQVFDPSDDTFGTWITTHGAWYPPTGGATANGIAVDRINNIVYGCQGGGNVWFKWENAFSGTPNLVTTNPGTALTGGSVSNGMVCFPDPNNAGRTTWLAVASDNHATLEFKVMTNLPASGWTGWARSNHVWSASGANPATTFTKGYDTRGWDSFTPNGSTWYVATSQGDGEIWVAQVVANYNNFALQRWTSGSPTGDVPTFTTESGHRVELVWLDAPYNCFAMAKGPTATAPGGAWFYKHTGWS